MTRLSPASPNVRQTAVHGQRPMWPLAFRTGLQPVARRGPRLRLSEPAAELRPGQLPLKHDNQSSPPAELRLFHVSVASDDALARELGAMGLL